MARHKVALNCGLGRCPSSNVCYCLTRPRCRIASAARKCALPGQSKNRSAQKSAFTNAPCADISLGLRLGLRPPHRPLLSVEYKTFAYEKPKDLPLYRAWPLAIRGAD